MRIALPIALAGSLLLAQAPKSPDPVAAAREIMAAARYCTLVTLDRRGAPDARMMDAFPMEADGSIWMATKAGSRKALQIRRDPRVTLLYFETASESYATLAGIARLVTDPAEKAKRWKDKWAPFYSDGPRGADYLLIQVRPARLEVSSPARGLDNDPKTWKAVTVALAPRS